MRAEPSQRLDGRLHLTTIAFVAVAGVTLLAAVSATFVRVPLNGNEGWNALHALHAMTRENLYAAVGYDNFPNYTPPYFYLLGWLGMLFGDYVFIGRVISIASLLVISLNVGITARALGAGRNGAWSSAALFFLITCLAARGYVAMNDPQLLAHAVQSTGLVLLLRSSSDRIGARRVLMVVALVLAGGLIKHNLIPVPLAITIWLAMKDRRALALWLVAGATGVALAGAFAYAVFGAPLFEQVFGHERQYSLGLAFASWRWLWPHLPFAIIAWLLAHQQRDVPGVRLMQIYLIAALLIGFLLAGGRGVNVNTYFDLSIASLPLVGLAITRSGFGTRQWLGSMPWQKLGLAVLVLVPVFIMGPAAVQHFVGRVQSLNDEDHFQPLLQTLAAADGPVACENQTICYWAGRDSAIDFSNMASILRVDPQATEEFLRYLESKQIVMILMGSTRSGRLTPAANAVLLDNYTAEVTSPMHVYVPKD